MAKKRGVALNSSAPRPVVSLVERQQQIAQRAFELYASRGYRQGYELEDWLEAEREVDHAA